MKTKQKISTAAAVLLIVVAVMGAVLVHI